ncbi:MAG: DedA family protein [Magnetococcales bacterium]|nr:DedA family protein [Magnetococcales bacterium]
MSLPELLAQYGYLALFIGALLEGETILILAGFAAFEGYLSFPLVVLTAFCGGTLGDQIYFYLGRYHGAPLLARFPHLAARVQPVNRLIVRYNTALIIGVRFMYGLRIAGPIIIGMSDVSAWRFLVFNVIGATIWAVVIAGVGYLFGPTLHTLLGEIVQYEEKAFLALIGVAVLFGLVRWFVRRRRSP